MGEIGETTNEILKMAEDLQPIGAGKQFLVASDGVAAVHTIACEVARELRLPLFVLGGLDYPRHPDLLPSFGQAKSAISGNTPVVLLIEQFDLIPESNQLLYLHLVDGGGTPSRRLAAGSFLLLHIRSTNRGRIEPLVRDRGIWLSLEE